LIEYKAYSFFLNGECHIARVNVDSPQTREVSRHDGPRVNQEITSPKVRLIDAQGEMLGVVSRSEALALAIQAGLDLVEVSPNAEPPVCKILDYGKFKYEQQKKKAEAKKKQKIIEVKEIQMRPMIDDNDLGIKCRAIKRFLEEGDKVKISMRFRGREMSHQEIGMGILLKVKQDFEELAKFETLPRFEGRQIVMIMAPK
jgi:translation initiation factor IF-3